MDVLFIFNDPPYGTERTYNGLRLAVNLLRNHETTSVTVFFMGDAVIVENLCAITARAAFEAVMRRLPFTVHTVQTDNGSEFAAEFKTYAEGKNLLRRMNDAYSPWQNGVVERFHRTVAEECYLGFPGDLESASTADLQAHLASYLEWYNGGRLHSSLGYQTPNEALAAAPNSKYDAPTRNVSNYPLS